VFVVFIPFSYFSSFYKYITKSCKNCCKLFETSSSVMETVYLLIF